MSAFGMDSFAAVQAVEIEIYTSAYRIAGTIHTPFRRVAEILNQLPSGHVAIDDATIAEYSSGVSEPPVASARVSVDEIVVMVAAGLAGEASAEMRIQKEPAWAVLSIPPLRLDGTVHVPVGSRAVDGLLNVADRFVPMTDVRLTSGMYPSLDREIPILAIRRDRAQVMVVTDGAPRRAADADFERD